MRKRVFLSPVLPKRCLLPFLFSPPLCPLFSSLLVPFLLFSVFFSVPKFYTGSTVMSLQQWRIKEKLRVCMHLYADRSISSSQVLEGKSGAGEVVRKKQLFLRFNFDSGIRETLSPLLQLHASKNCWAEALRTCDPLAKQQVWTQQSSRYYRCITDAKMYHNHYLFWFL